MAKRPWTVLPHDPIERHEENLWSVAGDLEGDMPLRRRMTIARLSDGRLVFQNAVPLDEASMKALEAWGEPAFVLVPNGFHRLDLAAWKERYPRLRFLTGAPSAKRVGQIVAVDGGWDLLPAEPAVELVPLSTKTGEGVLRVRSDGRTSLSFFGDVVMNNPDKPGVKGWVYGRVLGSTGGPRVTKIARLFIVGDAKKLATELRNLASDVSLVRMIPSHGHIMADRPGDVLRGLADSL